VVACAVAGAFLACVTYSAEDGTPHLDASAMDAPLNTSEAGSLPIDGATDAGSRYRAAILAAGPLVYWRMGIKAGASVVPDETGGGNNLLLQGSGHELGYAGAIEADDDTAIGFDGARSYAVATNARGLDFAGGAPFTLECWALHQAVDGGSYFPTLLGNIEGVPAASRNGYLLYTVPQPANAGTKGETAFEYATDSGARAVFGPLVPTGTWGYFVAVHDGSSMTLYVDGTVTQMVQQIGSLATRLSPLAVGRAPNTAGGYWSGAIDEVAIYGKALTLPEILEHRELGRKR
jgi:hypothetical protein